MDVQALYQQKKTTADEAVKCVRSGDWIDYGFGVNQPVALDEAIAKRLPELEDVNFRGAVLLHRPAIFDIPDPTAHMTWNSWYMTGVDRKAINEGFAYYSPLRYSELPKYYYEMECKPDVAMFQVTPMDEHGYFNFGPSLSHMRAVCDTAKTIILEVNENMPRCFGNTKEVIHISEVDMVVEGNNPLMGELHNPASTEIDNAVAKLIVEEITDGACLQLGIGAMASAVGRMIAESDLKDLGVHTEMYVDSFVDIAEAGKITGAKKNIDPYKQVYAFAAGSKRLSDYLNNNPSCMSAPVDYTNAAAVIGALDNFVSINNAVDFDLYGQINAESAGIRHISGSGGQQDFVLGAYLSKGGKSFVCASSTFKTKDGQVHSRIRPTLQTGSTVTDTKTNAHYLVTEYGKVNLKGMSSWQRAEAIIGLAHPDSRDELIKEAEKMRIWRKSNKIS